MDRGKPTKRTERTERTERQTERTETERTESTGLTGRTEPIEPMSATSATLRAAKTAHPAKTAHRAKRAHPAKTNMTGPSKPSPPVQGNERPLAGAGPVVTAFVLFGIFWGSWAVMLFDIQHAFHLNNAQLGVLLAVAIAVAGVSSAVMAHLADRVGARRLLWISLLAWAALLCVLALMEEKWAFAAVLVLTEVAGGSIDTAMNAEASHRLVNHPTVLVRLHALFNTGALCGAAVAALVIHAGVSWRWIWPGIAVVALVVGGWAAATDSGTPIAAASPDSAGPSDSARP